MHQFRIEMTDGLRPGSTSPGGLEAAGAARASGGRGQRAKAQTSRASSRQCSATWPEDRRPPRAVSTETGALIGSKKGDFVLTSCRSHAGRIFGRSRVQGSLRLRPGHARRSCVGPRRTATPPWPWSCSPQATPPRDCPIRRQGRRRLLPWWIRSLPDQATLEARSAGSAAGNAKRCATTRRGRCGCVAEALKGVREQLETCGLSADADVDRPRAPRKSTQPGPPPGRHPGQAHGSRKPNVRPK